MSKSGGKHKQNAKKKGPPKPAKAGPVGPKTYVPSDLCQLGIVQQGFGSFTPLPGIGTPLLATGDTSASPKTLAAESLIHAADGWRFLASAISALLSHAEEQAVHFAYYAEVRAAVSIFSSHGLRISYPNSSYLGPLGQELFPTWRKEPTHKLIWALWNEWTLGAPAESMFLDKLRVHPSVTLRPFRDSIAQVSASGTLAAWGRDLLINNEHVARNEASYQPIKARSPFRQMDAADFEFVRDLWALAEPTGVGLQFESQLVHWLLTKQAQSKPPTWLDTVLSEVERLTGVPASELGSMLALSKPASPVFDAAFDTAVGAKNIIARAYFLLRLATVGIDSGFGVVPTTAGKGWLTSWLEAAGFALGGTGASPSDLWADFEHLSSLPTPPLPLPARFFMDPRTAQDTLRLARPDAVLAWGVTL